MAATLDSSRFRNAIAAAAGVQPRDVHAITLGSHGDEMVPIVSTATVRGRPLVDVLPRERIAACVRETVQGGDAVVRLRRTGSATIAPAHATIELLEAIRGAQAGTVPASVYLQGEYGIEDLFLGVPAVLGRSGVLEIVELKLSEQERTALRCRRRGPAVGGSMERRPTVRLYALHCGGDVMDWAAFDPFDEPRGNEGQYNPYFMYVITHPEGTVLFDTGIHPQMRVDPEARLGPAAAAFDTRIGPEDHIEACLGRIGLTPGRHRPR